MSKRNTNNSITKDGSKMELKKTYKYFDLDTFESKSEEKTVSFEPAKDLAEAHTRVGGDESVLLKALNAFLKAQVLAQAEAEVTSKGGRKSVVLAIAKPFRALPPFNAMYELNADGTPKVADGEKVINRADQTKAILTMIKGNAVMLDAIRAGSQAPTEDETDGEDSAE